jgi:hypothetical protein
MRKRLMAAAAMAPLSLLGLHPADAQTTLSSSSAAPLSTSTSGDITIASGGTLTPTVSGAAVTINSNNSVTNIGTINTKDIDNVVGILATSGAYTGSISNQGAITLTESYTPSDSVNNDGIIEAPFAQGTNRIGIQTLGTLTGGVANTGTITIQGNNSTGLYIANGLNGTFLNSGTITVTGDNSFGLRTAGEITGAVQITGAVSAKGAGSVGVQTGKIDGALTVYSSITSTGYATTTRVTGTTALQKIQATPTDVEQGGAALQVQGSVSGGIFLGAPPSGTVSTDTTTDADHDGIVDSGEGTSSITTYGSAPAIQIGGPTAITIGNFGTTDNQFGLTIEGTVSAEGVFDGVSATAIDVGAGYNAGVNLGGGINIIGTVTASAYQADATAIHLESGSVVPNVRVQGNVASALTSGGANTATALSIDAGANVSTLFNYGGITSSVTGDTASAIAVVDKSGTLSYVENTGQITATITPTVLGDAVTGKVIALDLRQNTTGVTLRQEYNGQTPSIVGDIYLSPTGSNSVLLTSGTINGVLSLGSAPGSFTINGGSYTGALLYSGSQLAISVDNGALQNNSTTTAGLSSLTVGSAGKLIVALDPANKASTVYNVSGAATFANGATIGATLLSLPSGTQTFNIVKAGSLTTASTDANLLTALPYLFDGTLHSNTATGTIALTLSTKSPTELSLNRAETSAFSAVLAALPQDPSIQSAVISTTNRKSFLAAYDQLLPNSGGDVFQTALDMSKAVSRATSDRFDLSTQQDDDDAPDTTGVWASEYYIGIDQGRVENNAYHSAGLGVIGGVDFGGYGATLSLASANATHPHDTSATVNSISSVEGGLYLAPRFGPINFDARVAGGYLKMTDRRQFIASILTGDTSTTSTVTRTAEGDWNGFDATVHIGAAVEADVTKHLFFQPKIYADFFHVQEDAYNERGSSAGFNLNVAARNSTQTSATASLVTGLKFGSTFIFRPQLELGYDDVVQGGPGNTTARFAYGGSSFTVQPNTIGGAAIARIALKGDGNYVHFSFQGGGEFRNNYRALDLRAVFRMTY